MIGQWVMSYDDDFWPQWMLKILVGEKWYAVPGFVQSSYLTEEERRIKRFANRLSVLVDNYEPPHWKDGKPVWIPRGPDSPDPWKKFT